MNPADWIWSELGWKEKTVFMVMRSHGYLPNTREQESGTNSETERFPPPVCSPRSKTALNPMSREECHLVLDSEIATSWNGTKSLFLLFFSFCFEFLTYFHFRLLVQKVLCHNALRLVPLSLDPVPRGSPAAFAEKELGEI